MWRRGFALVDVVFWHGAIASRQLEVPIRNRQRQQLKHQLRQRSKTGVNCPKRENRTTANKAVTESQSATGKVPK
ncbi:hypothetical protein CBP13_02495, partial [Fischerella thermalis WC441]